MESGRLGRPFSFSRGPRGAARSASREALRLGGQSIQRNMLVSNRKSSWEAVEKMIRGPTRQEGFTLIELMVVVLIIAILIAIAVPSFIGLSNRGHDTQAKSNLRNGVTAAQAFYVDNESYVAMSAASLAAIQSGVPFANKAGVAASGDTVNTVYVDTGSLSAGTYQLSVLSRAAPCSPSTRRRTGSSRTTSRSGLVHVSGRL